MSSVALTARRRAGFLAEDDEDDGGGSSAVASGFKEGSNEIPKAFG